MFVLNMALFFQAMTEEVWVVGRDESEAQQRAAEKLGVLQTDIVLEQGEYNQRNMFKWPSVLTAG